MKECWINVYGYWYCPYEGIWYGECHSKKLSFHNKANEVNLLYRIHVRMK